LIVTDCIAWKFEIDLLSAIRLVWFEMPGALSGVSVPIANSAPAWIDLASSSVAILSVAACAGVGGVCARMLLRRVPASAR
jgi:pheromone shutdown protein TraB